MCFFFGAQYVQRDYNSSSVPLQVERSICVARQCIVGHVPYFLRVPKFYFRLVEFLGRGIGRSRRLYLHATTQAEVRTSYIDASQVGFKPNIWMSEQWKTVTHLYHYFRTQSSLLGYVSVWMPWMERNVTRSLVGQQVRGQFGRRFHWIIT